MFAHACDKPGVHLLTNSGNLAGFPKIQITNIRNYQYLYHGYDKM